MTPAACAVRGGAAAVAVILLHGLHHGHGSGAALRERIVPPVHRLFVAFLPNVTQHAWTCVGVWRGWGVGGVGGGGDRGSEWD